MLNSSVHWRLEIGDLLAPPIAHLQLPISKFYRSNKKPPDCEFRRNSLAAKVLRLGCGENSGSSNCQTVRLGGGCGA
jgi:hypothetical protein